MSSAGQVNSLLRLGVRAAPRRRLFCMPYAGGGVAPYRLWFKSLPDDIEVLAAQLPGRESRLRELPLSSIMAMVDTLLPAIEAASDLPYAIFGHSMGALIAYELTAALERRGGRAPSRLFVSARRPPDEPDTWSPIHELPEPVFLEELQTRYGAIPAAVLAEPELLELLLPVVRADIRAVETYWPSSDAPATVRCPVSVYGGDADTHPLPAQLPLWQRLASHPIRVRVFAGDHFYLQGQREALTADIAAQWPAHAGDAEHA
jgi:medium-chain acyl-[acyl-carrier-protein] hydrolase